MTCNVVEIDNIKLKNKILSLIGFAKKSGNLISGTQLVLSSVGKLRLVLIASDCSDGQMNKIIHVCKQFKIKYYIIFDREVLSKIIGEENRVCIGIKNNQFARSIEKYIVEGEKGGIYGENSDIQNCK